MKVKTSVSLSEELLVDMDRIKDRFESRSDMVETALRALIRSMAEQARDARDLAIFDRHAERLNAESADVLGYQMEPDASDATR